jgi:signal transduction histidine kinase
MQQCRGLLLQFAHAYQRLTGCSSTVRANSLDGDANGKSTVKFMSTSTRLFLLLSLSVGLVMTAASLSVLRERERSLQEAMRREVRAHALTLRLALEETYAAGREQDAQKLIDRLRDNTRLYSVVLFDREGRATKISNALGEAEELRQPPELARVLTQREPSEFSRRIKDEDVFSIVMPLVVRGETRGALEVVESLDYVGQAIGRTRRDWVLTTLALVATVLLVVFVTLRRKLSKPARELLGGARAIGSGDFDYRVIVPRGAGEFEELAVEFNRMADCLSAQRRATLREAEERLKLERELRHAERLAIVGRLAAGVAHELGAPLNVIDARAERLIENPEAAIDSRRRNLEIIRKQSARITHIVRQLLNLARPYDLRRTALDLNNLVADALESFAESATRDAVEIEFDSPAAPIIIEADADFLRQVFANVITNAIQAMPGGGILRVNCKTEATTGNESLAVLCFADTGTGIPTDALPHIFDPFFTTKDVGSGTGLGLAVSRRIIEEHNGRIEANNNHAGGATFTIRLPLAADSTGTRNDDHTRHDEREVAYR